MKTFRTACLSAGLLAFALSATAADPAAPTPLPDTGASLLRVVGALLFVFALLFGGVWLVRNWQRLALRRGGRLPKLRLLEAQSLGGRQGVYVVGYEQQRFLVAASPAGVALLSHLPEAVAGEAETELPAPVSFMQALQAVANRKS
jgi:flagellar biogenesis protein FliO